MKKKVYPHITRQKGILGGVPVVVGTRTPVRAIAGYYQMGMTVDEIVHALPHLALAKAHAALTYYFDHQREIDSDLGRTRDLAFWKKKAEKLVKVPA